ITDRLRSFLEDAGLADRPLAVRSSATAEDGAAASFAGIHRSVLNVRGIEATLAAVKGCYASLWTPQALAYRRRFGLSADEVACAVVVCAMVAQPDGSPPRSAGGAFSCDPRTGNRCQVVINAGRGLGDAVVAGAVNPEEIVVEQRSGRLRVVKRR